MAVKKRKPAKKRVSTGSGRKFSLDALSDMHRRVLLDAFARELEASLSSKQGSGELDRKSILEAVSKVAWTLEGVALGGRALDVRQFDVFLKHLSQDGYLRIGYHLLAPRAESLQKVDWTSGLQGVSVVAGNDPDRFALAAAEEFIEEIFRIGLRKLAELGEGAVLNIGVVSGNTTGSVIRAGSRISSWEQTFRKSAADLPTVKIFALNVCLTVPKHLSGNASLLAYNFSEKINEECSSREKIAHPYGLSAPLLVNRTELAKIDTDPQTYDVVKQTEPFRVRDKIRKDEDPDREIEEHESELDIVLTGVGELPLPGITESGGSIFFNLAKQFGFDMESLIEKERIVGDIAFTAIRSDGQHVPLLKGDDEYLFYSAVQLPVLSKLAKTDNKSVILVARSDPQKDKAPAIFASIAKHQYVSRLIVDESMAQELIHY